MAYSQALVIAGGLAHIPVLTGFFWVVDKRTGKAYEEQKKAKELAKAAAKAKAEAEAKEKAELARAEELKKAEQQKEKSETLNLETASEPDSIKNSNSEGVLDK